MVSAANILGEQEPSSWPSYNLHQLLRTIDEAREKSKYLFVWDKQGGAGTFLRYKGRRAPLAPEVVKLSVGQRTPADLAEFIRAHFIQGMKYGMNFCIDVDKTQPDFAAYRVHNTFDPEIFFDYERMKLRENYMQFVRAEEGPSTGGYERRDSFQLVIRCSAATEEDVNAITEKIPLFNSQFHHVIIE